MNDSRNIDGRFGRRCGSSLHEENRNQSLSLVDLRKRKGITRATFQQLLHCGAVTETTHYICKSCIELSRVRNNTQVQEKSREEMTKEKEKVEIYNKVVKIGKLIEGEVCSDIKGMRQPSLKSFEDINNHKPVKWLADRPENLIHLISAICNVDLNTTTPDQIIIICKVIELIYACKNSKLVLPNHFIENLLCYSYTNCKSFVNFLGNRSPGGAYTFLTNWLKEQSKAPLEFPKGLVKSVFDNSQKVGKTYLISGTNTVPTSVITSHLWITLNQHSDIQNRQDLSPKNWILSPLSYLQENDLTNHLLKPSMEFKVTRNRFIQQCLPMVIKEFESGTHDQIKVDVDPYKSFDIEPTSLPRISCMAGEPDFINPNSFYNIIQVLQAIGNRAGIKRYGHGSREWLMIECDGLPYNLIRHIIKEVLRCQECQKCFYGLPSAEDHVCFIVNQAELRHEFDWFVPVCGLLNLEMNLGYCT